MYFLSLLLLLPAIGSVRCDPILIKSNLAKTHGEEKNVHSYDANRHKGIANYEGEEGFNKNEERKLVSAADSGKFNEELEDKKQHLDQSNFKKDNFHENGGGLLEDYGNKVGHKKGHHKSGFHKSYHKDETGSDSSYYDDGEDEGGQYVHRSAKGSFGDSGHQHQQAGNLDSSIRAQDQNRRGHYDNAGKFEKDLRDERNYDKRNYYGDRENQARRHFGNNYDGGERFAEERHMSREPYYYSRPLYMDDAYRAPVAPRQITIYEDPTYDAGLDRRQRYNYDPDYHNDYVRLDVVRRPLNDYRYERRSPSYDYY